MKTALYKTLGKNAIIASKIAIAFSSPVKPQRQLMKKEEEAGKESSNTYSVYNVCKIESKKNDLSLLLSVYDIVKNNLSLTDKTIQQEIDKSNSFIEELSIALDSLVASKIKQSDHQQALWKQSFHPIRKTLSSINNVLIQG